MVTGKEYIGLSRIIGPIVFIERITGVGYGELVEIIDKDGTRLGRVLEVSEEYAVCQIFQGTDNLSQESSRVRFLGKPLEVPVTEEMIGRVFDGLGRPLDNGTIPFAKERRDVNGAPINPTAREYPQDFIQTGISAIDGMNTLIRGQKLPIFSGSGLPHNILAAQIVRQAKLTTKEEFVIVFVAIGIKHDDAEFFRRNFEETGALSNVVMFLNLADDPAIERLMTPRCALTLAEYLAFDKNFHVLVVLTDMTNYCEALREISTAREEVPSRMGYPGYLYSDLASIYERTGRVVGSSGSITQLPLLTMPNDDITHPIPDLTGYITEGQIVLSRELYQKGIYPPIAVLPSLSRLMKDGIGKGRTRADHPNWSSQLYAAYSRVQSARALASIIGEEDLSDIDKRYLEFGEKFEREFLNQGRDEDREIELTLTIGWKVLSVLPEAELHRVTPEEINKYYNKTSLNTIS